MSDKPGNMKEEEEENVLIDFLKKISLRMTCDDRFPKKYFRYDDMHTPDGTKGGENYGLKRIP